MYIRISPDTADHARCEPASPFFTTSWPLLKRRSRSSWHRRRLWTAREVRRARPTRGRFSGGALRHAATSLSQAARPNAGGIGAMRMQLSGAGDVNARVTWTHMTHLEHGKDRHLAFPLRQSHPNAPHLRSCDRGWDPQVPAYM